MNNNLLEERITNDGKSETKKITPYIFSAVIFVIALAVVLFAVLKFQNAIKVGAAAGMETYLSEEERIQNEVYNSYYQSALERAEAQNHVQNRVTIQIENITQVQKLEVISVRTDEYVIRKGEDHPEDGITCWYKVSVSGVYTVNLDYANCVVNDELKYVCVNIPCPELTVFHEPAKSEQILKINKGKNESYRVGEALIAELEEEGYTKAEASLINNQDYFTKAKNNAKENIESLIKSLNPEIPDLKVEVNFYNR